jgi:gamma-glutamyltranspeptidase / glutathione hydrolase
MTARNLALLLLLPVLISCAGKPAATFQYPEPARASGGMISSASEEATAAGVEILAAGGNAVDAAVAVGFALSVTLPQAGNLGGGGFMTIRMADGRMTTIDFREIAPAAATRDMYLDSAGNFLPSRSQLGALAVGVPGSPAGLLLALEKYGSLERERVIAPAIRLAENGFTVHPDLARDISDRISDFKRFPSSAAVFAPADRPITRGANFRQPDLAATLQRISKDGAPGFYTGRTADLFVEEMKRSGGIITHADLSGYRPAERPPVVGSYRGNTIISMPPPSSGGVLLVQMLNMLEGYDFSEIPWHSAEHAHILAETMRRAYADRAEFLGDPDFTPVPVAGLISRRYADARRATIGSRATPSREVGHGDPAIHIRESDQTTHYSVIDRHGNCASVTVTLNGSFGSKLVVGGAGFLLNNEMDDFSAKPGVANMYGLVGNEANAIVPGKRMLSSMTPTIVLRDGRPWLDDHHDRAADDQQRRRLPDGTGRGDRAAAYPPSMAPRLADVRAGRVHPGSARLSPRTRPHTDRPQRRLRPCRRDHRRAGWLPPPLPRLVRQPRLRSRSRSAIVCIGYPPLSGASGKEFPESDN